MSIIEFVALDVANIGVFCNSEGENYPYYTAGASLTRIAQMRRFH